MASQPPTEIPETVVQQSILQQAQAAAAVAELESRPETLLEHADLVTPDATENDIPPPAYNDIYSYGEIRDSTLR